MAGVSVWKLKVPPRMKTFLRILFHGRLLTNGYRQHCQLASSTQCSICLNGDETIAMFFGNVLMR